VLDPGSHSTHRELQEVIGSGAVVAIQRSGAQDAQHVDLELGEGVDVRRPQVDAPAQTRAALAPRSDGR